MSEDKCAIKSSTASETHGLQAGTPDSKQLPYYLSWYRGVFCGNGLAADEKLADTKAVTPGEHRSS